MIGLVAPLVLVAAMGRDCGNSMERREITTAIRARDGANAQISDVTIVGNYAEANETRGRRNENIILERRKDSYEILQERSGNYALSTYERDGMTASAAQRLEQEFESNRC